VENLTLGEKIQELRLDKGLKQKDLAKVLNVTISTISHYELDIHSPELEIFKKIAIYFNVSADYLLGTKNEPTPYNKDDRTVIRLSVKFPEELKKELKEYVRFLTLKHKKESKKRVDNKNKI